MDFPPWASINLKISQSVSNKVGFILQLGYFRVASRFFDPKLFSQKDMDHVAIALNLEPNDIDMAGYAYSGTNYRHRGEILDGLGFQPFDQEHKEALTQEAKRLTALQTKPAPIFDTMVAYLQERRTEVPTYNMLRDILSKALASFARDLENIIQANLQGPDKLLLDELSEKTGGPSEKSRGGGEQAKYGLTFIKRITQTMSPLQIKERVGLFAGLKNKYDQLLPIIGKLNLSSATVRYFADYVMANQTSQPLNRTNEHYLQLIAFIIHQYFSFGDALVLTLSNAVTSATNNADGQLKEDVYQSRNANAELVHQVSRRSGAHIDSLETIESIIDDGLCNDTQKVDRIRKLIRLNKVGTKELNEDQQRLAELRKANQPVYEQEDHYRSLEKESIRLQGRVSGIICKLAFDLPTSQKDIGAAISHFQEREGNISQGPKLPILFLDMLERGKIFDGAGKLRVSLYKILFFREVMAHIKRGSLNISSSYDYRSFEEYLIPAAQWAKNKDGILKKANLTKYRDAAQTISSLGRSVNGQFATTNQNLPANKGIYFDNAGQWHLHRYRAENVHAQIDNKLLYPPNRSISLLEVLAQINQFTGFLSAFQHKAAHYVPPRPSDLVFYAAIIGFGANIGIPEMASISTGVPANTLETVANQYFSPSMTLAANDMVLAKSNGLPIVELFRQRGGFVHTGSDGQKYDVSVPCLRASASFKYFGSGKGVTVYSHLDEAGQLLFSTVFSASEKEAHHVLDGLVYNEVVTPDAHSTDSHGFTDPVAAIAGLLGIEFRPRLAGLHKRQLYSVDEVRSFRDKGYKIVPDAKIDYERLVSQWDTILRMAATIKLGHNKASSLFRRLNSYARQNPTYKALSDLGRLSKTKYILRYIDEPPLRKSVEGVLSIVEHANNLALAITHGNNQQLIWASHDDQLKAEGCKRLIMNCVNKINLLLLSEKATGCKTDGERKELLAIIARSSPHTWRHINFLGTYDFSVAIAGRPFDMDGIMKLNPRP